MADDKNITQINAAAAVQATDLVPIAQGDARLRRATAQQVADFAAVNGTFLQAGSGAVQRTSQSKDRDELHLLDFVPADVTDLSAVDCSVYVQRAFDASSTQKKTLQLPGGVISCRNIVLKSFLNVRGHKENGTIFRLWPTGPDADLFVSEGFLSLVGTDAGPTAYPQHITLEQVTLDGNGDVYQPATRGRVLCTYVSGLRLNGVVIVNGWRQGFWREGPTGLGGGWPRSQDGGATIDDIRHVWVYRCNLSREPDVPGAAGGGAYYCNGTSDARHDSVFVAYMQGGYGIKIGPKGASRFVGGEMWGGTSTLEADNLTGSVTYSRSGTTATLSGLPITPAYKAMRVGEEFVLYGQLAVDAGLIAYYGKVLTVSGGGATITFTVPNSGATAASGEVVLNRQLFATHGIISEALDGFTGFGFKFAGCGYSSDILVRANGFKLISQHCYMVAGNGTRAGIIRKFMQLGDPANGYNNVAGVVVDAFLLDFLAGTVDFASSGGFNIFKIRGYNSYSGFSVAPTGTPNVLDEIDIRVDGLSTCELVRQRFATIRAESGQADGLVVIGRALDGIGAITLKNHSEVSIFKIYNNGTSAQVEMNGTNAFRFSSAGDILPNVTDTISLGDSSFRWRAALSQLDLTVPSYASNAAAAAAGLPVGRVYHDTGVNALRVRQP